MKNGLMICKGTGVYKNIGDYIQSLAAELFFDKVDVLVEREELSTYRSFPDKTKLIMNGWFMHRPQNFPPSNDIVPLLTSFHVVPKIAEKILTPQGIEFFKKYAPVGCRDTGTQELLEAHDIPCYFSGCLTLTLGEKYKSETKSGEIIFVDPYYEWIRDKNQNLSLRLLMQSVLSLIRYFPQARKIAKNIECVPAFKRVSNVLKLKNLLKAAAFYKAYSNKFDDEVLSNAVFISHSVPQALFKNEQEKLDYSRNLIKRYAEAKLVITSRIHCALPCLSVETPVIFITSENLESNNAVRSAGRFRGLTELFRVMKYNYNELTTNDEILMNITKMKSGTVIENKINYLKYKELLVQKCREFAQYTIA